MSAIDFGDCLLLGIVQATAFGFCLLRVVINGPFFFFSFFAENSRKDERNATCPIIMYHEVATLVHLIESSNPEVRAEGIRLIVLLGVPS